MNKNKHFLNYPSMTPHIGSEYISITHKRILILGESHYQPKGSKAHINCELWYESTEASLTEKELGWIRIKQLIRDAKEERYRNKAHGIYREISRSLSNAGLNLECYTQGIEHCMFMNYFQRPAEETGKSILVKQRDVEVSEETLKYVLDTYSPELIIVTSRLAGRYASKFLNTTNIPFVVTPHPSTAWWNREAKKYNGLKGREIFSDFLKNQEWIS